MPSAAIAPVGLVELLGSISLATDMATGQPPGHGLRTAMLAAGLARQLGHSASQADVARQVALLRFLGCTADSAETAQMAGGDDLALNADMATAVMGSRAEAGKRVIAAVGKGQPPLRRARLLAGTLADRDGLGSSLTAHCEVAARLADRLGLAPQVVKALAHGYERWDGAGFPDGLAGDTIPLAVRIAVVARDADLLWQSVPAELGTVLRARRELAYDPAVVDAFTACGRDLLAEADVADPWQAATADAEGRMLVGEQLDRALVALGDFADLKSPWTRGHSGRVADLVAAASERIGRGTGDQHLLRRAALVADLGRVGVPNGIWDRRGPLGVADWDRVHLHPYFTERILARCAPLAAIGRLAATHHERLDGSGYHRACGAAELDTPMRLLAVADAVAAMSEPRPHRATLASSDVAREVEREVRAGKLDATAADAVLEAAGHRARGARRSAGSPHGLTERELQVLRLIARGRTNRGVAADLRLSPKTVGRHVENLYAKIGVSTRAGAALFAMENRLLDE